jgi:hypothetical protein
MATTFGKTARITVDNETVLSNVELYTEAGIPVMVIPVNKTLNAGDTVHVEYDVTIDLLED